jgi:hypothetical protein
MTRTKVWFWMSVGGFISWAMDGYEPRKFDSFASGVLVSGLALLIHWINEPEKGGTP